jgi:hypothetical protein
MLGLSIVMPGLVPGIHAFSLSFDCRSKTWMAGTSPAMTALRVIVQCRYVRDFFRFAASALSLRKGRERGHTSARKCTRDDVSASSLMP